MIVPRSRFGDIPVAILHRPDEVTDWTPNVNLQVFHFPGGNVSEVQNLGMGMWEVSHLLHFATAVDFAAFLELLGTEQTLRMPQAGVSAYAGDHAGTEHGEDYKEFSAILLASIDNVELRFEGAVRCQVTFRRAVPS